MAISLLCRVEIAATQRRSCMVNLVSHNVNGTPGCRRFSAGRMYSNGTEPSDVTQCPFISCPASQWLASCTVPMTRHRKKGTAAASINKLEEKAGCIAMRRWLRADVLEIREDEERYNEQKQRDDAASKVNVSQDHCSANLLQRARY